MTLKLTLLLENVLPPIWTNADLLLPLRTTLNVACQSFLSGLVLSTETSSRPLKRVRLTAETFTCVMYFGWLSGSVGLVLALNSWIRENPSESSSDSALT